jgi:hypothetical protein
MQYFFFDLFIRFEMDLLERSFTKLSVILRQYYIRNILVIMSYYIRKFTNLIRSNYELTTN